MSSVSTVGAGAVDGTVQAPKGCCSGIRSSMYVGISSSSQPMDLISGVLKHKPSPNIAFNTPPPMVPTGLLMSDCGLVLTKYMM